MTTDVTEKKLDKRSKAYSILKEWLSKKIELNTLKRQEKDLREAALGVLRTCLDGEALVDNHIIQRKVNKSSTVPYKTLYEEALEMLSAKDSVILKEKKEESTKRSEYEKITVKEVSV